MQEAGEKKSSNSNSYGLKSLSVLITGGNGQLGSALTEHFLMHGAHVHISDLQPSISEKLAARLKKLKLVDWKYYTMDVTDEASVSGVMDKIGSLDVLVNNAGTSVFTPFESRTPEEIDLVMDVNIKGTILCSKAAAGKMGKSGGVIINIGSIYGVVPADKKIYGDSGRNNSEVYGATKAGVIHMTKYLAAHLGDKNIRVNAVSPGGIFNDQKQIFVDNYVKKTPLGRMASEDDIAETVLFLSSEGARYITGQNITIDGGFSLNQ